MQKTTSGQIGERNRTRARDTGLPLRWLDGVAAVIVVLIVRVMARGITLMP